MNLYEMKVEAVAASFFALCGVLSAEEAEAKATSLASSECDSQQIADGIALGKQWAGCKE